MKKDEQFITVAEYASHVCVSRQAIEKAIKFGRLPDSVLKTEAFRGKQVTRIDRSAADMYWVNSFNPMQGTASSKAAVLRLREELNMKGQDTPQSTAPEAKAYVTHSEAQRLERVAKAEIARLTVNQLKGSLVERDVVYRQLFEAGQMLRDAIMAVPDRITSDIVAAAGNHTQIRKILTEALASSLEGLADVQTNKYG